VTERERFEDQLARLVAVPTVSSDPAHAADIVRGAELAAALLDDAGLAAEIVPTPGNPVVLARHAPDPRYPTLTIYNHLDVQPADPSE
jgi:acetylornithine deacetylase/succinyl-diaminopimelate desuccinylase-like protein